MDSNRVAVDRYKRMIAIMVVMTWSGVVAASELIDFEERDKLNNINSSYEQQYSELRIDENIARFNKLNADIESTKIKLDNNIEMIKSETSRLKDKLVEGVYDESLILTLRNLSAKVNSMKHQIETAGKQLAETKKELSHGQQQAAQVERVKNDAILALYEQIKSRHMNEAKQVVKDTYEGSLQCNVAESLSTCVNRNLPSIKNAFVISKGGLSRIKLTGFRVVDATQRLNGDLSFIADASYKHSYSTNTEVELRKALNLDNVRFVFRSNSSKTSFYINDQKVGSGERVDVTGNYVGVYSVRAVNNGKAQSLKLNLKNGGDYFFPFASKTSSDKLVLKETSNAISRTIPSSHKTKFTKSVLNPSKIKEATSASSKNETHYTNKVIYKDQAFTYLSPRFQGNKKSHDLFLNREDAIQYCEQRLSSKLPTQAAYQYLELYTDLAPGDYWTQKGKVYSSEKHEELDKAFDTNRFICMVSMN